MQKDLLQLQIALQFLNGIGLRRARLLAAQYADDLSLIFTSSLKTLHSDTGLPINTLKAMQRIEALNKAEPFLNPIIRGAYQCIFISDKSFPRRLKHCDDAPLLLFGYGNLDLNPKYSVALIGTRKPSHHGIETCKNIIDELNPISPTVISGMAYGIDIVAHKRCVEHNIQTIGVLGHGLDRLYPSLHKPIARKMLENGGLITEFLPGCIPDREHFPQRNRIVAGMTDATIVVESKASGGSLNTARLANDYNRDVFAVPGSLREETSVGCNELIANQKAHLFLSTSKFLETMNWDKSSCLKQVRPLPDQLNETQIKIFDLLKDQSFLHFDHIVSLSDFKSSEVSTALFELEMMGILRAAPGMMYTLQT